jgi:hypothetical protein
MHIGQLIKAIKAHIAKGDHATDKAEQHYISAGQHLKTLKAEHDGSWAEWTELLRTKCDLSTGRASELMQIADGRTSQEKIRAKDKDRKKLTRSKKPSSGHPEEDPPAPITEPDGEPAPTKPDGEPSATTLIMMWGKAGTEARREFVRACWDEIVRTRDQAGPAKPNGNAGADHWAHLPKNTEVIDRWIVSDR